MTLALALLVTLAASRAEAQQLLTPAANLAVQRSFAAYADALREVAQLGVQEGVVAKERQENLHTLVMGLLDGLALQVAYLPDSDLEAVRQQALDAIERLIR